MIGRLFIDGEDAYVTYCVAVCQGGYDRLVEFPKPKKYTTTDWHEEDGIEIDENMMMFDGRQVAINFVCYGSEEQYQSFIGAISDGVVHTFNFAAISLSCGMRYVSCSSYQQGKGFSKFTITFGIDVDIFSGYTYATPTLSQYGNNGNQFNLMSFRCFGMSILGDYKNELFKATNAKKALQVSYDDENGLQYDNGDDVKFEQRKSKLQFLMQSDTWGDLWQRWYALLYNIANPGKKHLLTIDDIEDYQFTVWYDGMNVEQLFTHNGKVAVKFSIDFYSQYGEDESDLTALITESDEVVTTEDGFTIEV